MRNGAGRMRKGAGSAFYMAYAVIPVPYEGKTSASLILSKLGSYSRQNALATALREIGRIGKTTFILDYTMKFQCQNCFRNFMGRVK